MGLRVLAGLLWLGLVVEAFGFAPAATPGTGAMVWKMLSLQTQGIEPWVFAIFNSLGIVPMVYACLLLPEPKQSKVPAWPFVGLSFFLGAFGLFPYLMLRHSPTPEESENAARALSLWQRLSESKLLAGFLLASSLALMGYGLLRGNVQAFAQAWKTNQLVHIMSLDFAVLALVCPWLIRQDWKRRGGFHAGLWLLTWTPVVGGTIYLLLRPSTPVPE